jgi:hypothetical protein
MSMSMSGNRKNSDVLAITLAAILVVGAIVTVIGLDQTVDARKWNRNSYGNNNGADANSNGAAGANGGTAIGTNGGTNTGAAGGSNTGNGVSGSNG